MNDEESGEKAIFTFKDTIKTVMCDTIYTVMNAQSYLNIQSVRVFNQSVLNDQRPLICKRK